MAFTPGSLVNVRGRDWVVMPSEDADLLLIKPLGGSEEETTGIYLPFAFPADKPTETRFPSPTVEDLGDFSTTRMLYNAARLSFRNGAGAFRCLAKLSFRPRSYQMVPLIMALRQDNVRLLVADDVGVGKTIEALLIAKEMLERRVVRRFAVVCLPHLCDQWQAEIKDKLGLEAVIIRTNTQARLDREIQGDVSVYSYYPYQIISIDFIKSDSRRQVFINECPELVIVDEVHSCARPAGASRSQQQRYALVSDIAARADQHLIMLTATPHSGKQEEFQSLLGLLNPDFESMDVATASQATRRELARHFVQRKRADVEKWLEDTPFPTRIPGEIDYKLSRAYAKALDAILDFARKLVTGDQESSRRLRRLHYWTALGLLRGVMSSPAAGIAMLQKRLTNLNEVSDDTAEEVTPGEADDPIHDVDNGYESDVPASQVVEQSDWSEYQQKQLRSFTKSLEGLANPTDDQKLSFAATILTDWLKEGFNTVVFCRYIATAKYVGEQLKPLLQKKYPKVDLQVITSEEPDDIRKSRVDAMEGPKPRILVCTDCLSEGINLQKLFTAVLHYDLPWNPNRLEQREGRVDRYGQTAKTVKAFLLYGSDNPIDGIVLDVILRKVREIKRDTGINVPFPEESKSIIDTIAQALLMNPDRRISASKVDNQMKFDFDEFDEARKAKLSTTDKMDRMAQQEKTSRAIFAQNAIKAQEIETDLKETDEAIGDPQAVKEFLLTAVNDLLGAQMIESGDGFKLFTTNLPPAIRSTLPTSDQILLSFDSPTPDGYLYIGRNHSFVEQTCQLVLANTIHRKGKHAARSAVIRTRAVTIKTTILLFRVRNVIESRTQEQQIVAEEMMVWGYRGSGMEGDFLTSIEAKELLLSAQPTANLTPQARADYLRNELALFDRLHPQFDKVAEERSQHLVDAHERFSKLMDRKRFQVVHPVLPMDIIGIYVLLPDR
jgi:superfamily II DNA or RNA helicase